MNLDDLKTKWAEQDEKLDRIMQFNATAVREIQLSKTKSSLQWLVPGVVIELLLTLIAAVWLGGFIADHLLQWKFLLPAVSLDVCAILLAGTCIRQLVVIGSLDYGGPVVTVQKELEQLRVLRIRSNKWAFRLSCILWAPLIIVLSKGLLGADIYFVVAAIQNRDENFVVWIMANLILGAAAFLLALWASNRYADRFEHSPFVKSIMDDFAGRSLMNALHSLDSIAEFEAEVAEEPDSNQ